MTSRDATTTASAVTQTPLADARPGIDGDPGLGLAAVPQLFGRFESCEALLRRAGGVADGLLETEGCRVSPVTVEGDAPTDDGRTADVTPEPFNVRTRVHEYGGGAFSVSRGVVYFSNFADQRLYRQEPGGRPKPLTPEAELRYADVVIDRGRGRMLCVREDHTAAGKEAVNTIVSLDLEHGGFLFVVHVFLGHVAPYPTLPSRLMPMSFCASTANSMGSSCMTSRQNPLTMRATAVSSSRPRWRQ